MNSYTIRRTLWLALLPALFLTGCKPSEEEPGVKAIVGAVLMDGTGGPPDSLGNPGPKNFTDPKFQLSMTDAQIKNAIENGNRGMPAFGAVFTPPQVELLVAHVRRFGPDGQKRDAR